MTLYVTLQEVLTDACSKTKGNFVSEQMLLWTQVLHGKSTQGAILLKKNQIGVLCH